MKYNACYTCIYLINFSLHCKLDHHHLIIVLNIGKKVTLAHLDRIASTDELFV